jgi:hypothetical protein
MYPINIRNCIFILLQSVHCSTMRDKLAGGNRRIAEERRCVSLSDVLIILKIQYSSHCIRTGVLGLTVEHLGALRCLGLIMEESSRYV